MPLVRIDLIEGKLPEYRASIGQVVYEQLIAVFGVPKNDRLQSLQSIPGQACTSIPTISAFIVPTRVCSSRSR
ncbi:MAG: hypothetical protein JWO80_5765 [Bryobacterales bacterium]|nr:hypothetical protein [Bryobacterales bacterium]